MTDLFCKGVNLICWLEYECAVGWFEQVVNLLVCSKTDAVTECHLAECLTDTLAAQSVNCFYFAFCNQAFHMVEYLADALVNRQTVFIIFRCEQVRLTPLQKRSDVYKRQDIEDLDDAQDRHQIIGLISLWLVWICHK